MAGNGTVLLQVNPYSLAGLDTTQRSAIVEGMAIQYVTSGTIITITAWSITSNVLTFTANNALTGGGGQVIQVYGFTGSQYFLNGTYTTSSATSTTIVVPLTHANGSGTQGGIATLQPTYQTGGIPISYSFIDLKGNSLPVGLIGPKSSAKWINFQTIAGSALNYKVNLTGTTPLFLAFNGITQISDATGVTYDAIAFRAEFIKNAY